jgi:Xaa-Pro dipeptidase
MQAMSVARDLAGQYVMQDHMVFSIESGVYLVGQFGVRIEDIVLATQSGVRSLTGFDHSLVIKD